jgi:hypothetical protein
MVGWTHADADDAWLVMDRNGNGVVDDGAELFGNNTPVYPDADQSDVTTDNGFEVLRFLQGSGYGVSVPDAILDRRDAAFHRLLLWRDVNHDGLSTPDELSPASSALRSIAIDYRTINKIRKGNAIRQVSSVTHLDGRERAIIDIWLDEYHPTSSGARRGRR